MRKRVLLLGGSGLVGSCLAEEIASAHDVTTTSTTGAGADRPFDVCAPDGWAKLVGADRYDTVVNCTVRHAGSLGELFDVHVAGALRLVGWLRDAPTHFIQVSSISAIPGNRNQGDYALTKFLADELLLHASRTGSWRVSVLRFPQIFDVRGRSRRTQPGLHRWVSQIRSGQPIEVFTGSDARRSYIAAPLAAKAIRRCLEEEIVGVHDVIPAERFTLLELATLLTRIRGADPGTIRQNSSVRPAEYVIPECSQAFTEWLAAQEPCESHFRRLMEQEDRDGG